MSYLNCDFPTPEQEWKEEHKETLLVLIICSVLVGAGIVFWIGLYYFMRA